MPNVMIIKRLTKFSPIYFLVLRYSGQKKKKKRKKKVKSKFARGPKIHGQCKVGGVVVSPTQKLLKDT